MNDMTREEMLAHFRTLQEANKFGAKLTFDQRCEILALRHAGVRREVLAKMYGVDRRTVTHIYNPLSRHYKNVRELEIGMGRERFREKFAHDDLLAAAMSQVREEQKENNKYANAKQGIHVVRGPMCTYDHRVAIAWKEAGEVGVVTPGWYYRDLDGDLPDSWFYVGEESLKNSQACYNAMLNEITDKME